MFTSALARYHLQRRASVTASQHEFDDVSLARADPLLNSETATIQSGLSGNTIAQPLALTALRSRCALVDLPPRADDLQPPPHSTPPLPPRTRLAGPEQCSTNETRATKMIE